MTKYEEECLQALHVAVSTSNWTAVAHWETLLYARLLATRKLSASNKRVLDQTQNTKENYEGQLKAFDGGGQRYHEGTAYAWRKNHD